MLPQDGAPIEQQEFERALDALRSIMPDALTKDDPTPARTVVYGLHVDRMTGRMAGNDTPRRGRAAQPVRGAPKQRRPRDAF
jgi:hypothetical protein